MLETLPEGLKFHGIALKYIYTSNLGHETYPPTHPGDLKTTPSRLVYKFPKMEIGLVGGALE